jgi:uncharacterized YccA/Bax inhibitor family protein
MASANPAFRNNPVFNGNGAANAPATISSDQLNDMYQRPSASGAETGRMTYDDVIVKTLLTFALVVVAAAIGWFIPALVLPGAIIGLVLGLVNAFKKEPSPALILAYAGAQGLFVGGLSGMLEGIYPGIVVQALLGTFAVFGVTLALFANGKVRASKRATKVFLIAMVGYLVFSVLNLVLSFTGIIDTPFGLRGAVIFGIPLGVVIGVLVVIMAAYSLVLDFDFVQRGVKAGAPRKYSWTAAFGLTVTIIWLYVEILRLIAIVRQ